MGVHDGSITGARANPVPKHRGASASSVVVTSRTWDLGVRARLRPWTTVARTRGCSLAGARAPPTRERGHIPRWFRAPSRHHHGVAHQARCLPPKGSSTPPVGPQRCASCGRGRSNANDREDTSGRWLVGATPRSLASINTLGSRGIRCDSRGASPSNERIPSRLVSPGSRGPTQGQHS